MTRTTIIAAFACLLATGAAHAKSGGLYRVGEVWGILGPCDNELKFRDPQTAKLVATWENMPDKDGDGTVDAPLEALAGEEHGWDIGHNNCEAAGEEFNDLLEPSEVANMIRILTALSLLLATEAHGTSFAIPNSEAYYCEWTHSTMKTNGFIIADGDNVAGQSLAIVTGDYAYLCSGNSKCTRFEYVKTDDIGMLTYTDNDGMYMMTSVMMLEIAGTASMIARKWKNGCSMSWAADFTSMLELNEVAIRADSLRHQFGDGE